MAPAEPATTEVDGRLIKLTNLEKVLYPVTGTTKADVIGYYQAVASVMLPHLTGRPATRKRWPNGVDAPDFFVKNVERGTPEWLERVQLEHSTGPHFYPLIQSTAALVWMAQNAALEIHVPQWRIDPAPGIRHAGRAGGTHRGGTERHPDRIVFDLDPGPGAGLTQCVEVAMMVRQRLGELGDRTVPVTSGSKGLHLYVPMDAPITSEQATAWAKTVAEQMQAAMPGLVVSKMTKSLRHGRVFFDWSQNSSSKTTIAPYSLRGRTEPTVAAPRTWDELAEPDLQHLDFRQVMERVASGFDPLGVLAGLLAPNRTPTATAPPASGRIATKSDPDKLRRATGVKPTTTTPPDPNFPADLTPMLATAGKTDTVADERWRYEGKWDGMRALSFINAGALTVRSRTGRDNTTTFPELAELTQLLAGHNIVLDGEIVVFDSTGRTDFGKLQHRMGLTKPTGIAAAATRYPASYLIFDVLYLDGVSLINKKYDQRRRILEALPLAGQMCWAPEQLTGDVDQVMADTRADRWEGIIAKRGDSLYLPGTRAKSWVKVKHDLDIEVVIVGWQPGNGRRSNGIGSLILAIPDDDTDTGWSYVGKVGTGFTDRMLQDLAAQLEPLTIPRPPLDISTVAADVRAAHWVQPHLVAEVLYSEMTAAGTLRHPRWKGLRPDKLLADFNIKAAV